MFFNNHTKELKEKEDELLKIKSELGRLQNELLSTQQDYNQATNQINTLRKKYSHLINLDEGIEHRNKLMDEVRGKLELLNEKFRSSLAINKSLEDEINVYKDTLEVRSFGLYEPQFSFDTSERYKDELELNYIKQKDMYLAGDFAEVKEAAVYIEGQ